MNEHATPFDDVLSLRASGHVRRWHTIRTVTQTTVAEHTGQALSLLLLLYPAPGPSINLIKSLAWHDSAERIVGDVPGPTLRTFPAYKELYEQLEQVVMMRHHPAAIVELTNDEKTWLKACDVLELYLHCHDEIRLGNSHFHVVMKRAEHYLKSPLCSTTPREVLDFVEWFEVVGKTRSFA